MHCVEDIDIIFVYLLDLRILNLDYLFAYVDIDKLTMKTNLKDMLRIIKNIYLLFMWRVVGNNNN